MITPTSNRATVGKVLVIAVLLAAIAACLGLASGPAYASTTFYVNSVADHADANLGVTACDTGYVVERDGGGQEAECTLRAAIEQANYTPGADTVKFAIPGGGVKTIAPASDLPRIAEALTVDGYTQPGASPNTRAVGSDAVLKIELRGPGNGHGLVVEASNSTVRGLVINRSGEGVRITGSGATGNRVEGNYLGTDPSGTQKLGNGDYGVAIGGAPNNTIGGTTPGARNLISGNLGGVGIEGNGATGNKVTGNYIGTDRNGTADLGNSSSGVLIDGAPGNTVGGAVAGARNVISGNGIGVFVQGDGATGNRVLSNSIFGNVALGIDLYGALGPNPNDPDDKDAGPNGLQNRPLLSSARKSATGTTTVRGKLDSTSNATFRVQFFSNPEGGDEGKTLLGSIKVSTGGSGEASFAFSTRKAIRLGQNITATATNTSTNNTSEFSAPRKVVAR
jgi:CSLREA domain-containing protein